MKADTLIKEVQARKIAAARQIAASSAPLIAPDVRRAMIKRAAKLTLKKMAGRSRRDKLAAVAAIVAVGLGHKKIAGDFNSLKAELEACKLIGQFERDRSKVAAMPQILRQLMLRSRAGGKSMLSKLLPAAAGGVAGAAGGVYAGSTMMPPKVQLKTVPNGPDWSNSVDSAMKRITQELHRRQALTATSLLENGDPMQQLDTINNLMRSMKSAGASESKEAGLGSMIGRGIGRLGRGLMSRPGGWIAGSAIGAGLAGQQQLQQAGTTIGGRMMNAYNSLFNPSAVQTPQSPAAGPRGPAPSQNPFDMDFNTMTMADFARHRTALQQRMTSMDQAYPGFAPQQPQQPVFQVQPTPAQPKMTYNPNGNIPRYYGLG